MTASEIRFPGDYAFTVARRAARDWAEREPSPSSDLVRRIAARLFTFALREGRLEPALVADIAKKLVKRASNAATPIG